MFLAIVCSLIFKHLTFFAQLGSDYRYISNYMGYHRRKFIHVTLNYKMKIIWETLFDNTIRVNEYDFQPEIGQK